MAQGRHDAYGIQRYGANTTFLAGADQDPVEALKLATSAPAHVTDLGPDWLPDNTLNTHYRATVRVLDVAKAAGVKGAGLKALKKALGSDPDDRRVGVEGGEGRPRAGAGPREGERRHGCCSRSRSSTSRSTA